MDLSLVQIIGRGDDNAFHKSSFIINRVNIMLTRDAIQHRLNIVLIAIGIVVLLVRCVNAVDVPVRHHVTVAPPGVTDQRSFAGGPSAMIDTNSCDNLRLCLV